MIFEDKKLLKDVVLDHLYNIVIYLMQNVLKKKKAKCSHYRPDCGLEGG